MYDYIFQISEFVKENFAPVSIEEANVKMTSDELLGFIFGTFPKGCISDYELNDIMVRLGFFRATYIVEDKDKSIDQIVSGWCMESAVLKSKILNTTNG